MDIFYRPPAVIRLIFPGIIWENRNSSLLFTVDDGPTENTPYILDELDKYSIKALFFCNGKNIRKYTREFEDIIKRGHSAGSHGMNHNRLIFRNRKKNIKEVLNSRDIIFDMTGNYPKYFRPPYGLFNHHTLDIVKKAGMNLMMWNLMTGDHTGDFALVRRLTDTYLQKNSIIVMHDNKKSRQIFNMSLKYIIDSSLEKGFKFE